LDNLNFVLTRVQYVSRDTDATDQRQLQHSSRRRRPCGDVRQGVVMGDAWQLAVAPAKRTCVRWSALPGGCTPRARRWRYHPRPGLPRVRWQGPHLSQSAHTISLPTRKRAAETCPRTSVML